MISNNINNSVADYKTEWLPCETCDGVGTILITNKKHFIELMEKHGIDDFRGAMYYKHQYKTHGFIDCPVCDGKRGMEIMS